jgi:alpha-galactosidase
MVSSGLRDAGYVYVNIDDSWQGRRDAAGVLNANEKFPDMKALANYLHARGLKFGIYSSPGLVTCDGYLGSHGHEAQDALTFAQWGVDYLKYDWCFAAATLYKTQLEMQALYQIMGEALQATGRPIVYGLCQYGLHDVGSWGRKVGGNLWRTGYDSVAGNLWLSIDQRFDDNGKPHQAGPGGWNDADMMLVGLPGLTEEEYRTHFTLWAMAASPLILGNDIRAMTPPVQALLTNKDVIAVDQDVLGEQGHRVSRVGPTEIWKKRLADGSIAVALFNRGAASAEMQVRWKNLGIERVAAIRNLWARTNMQAKGPDFRTTVPPHGAVLLRVEVASDLLKVPPTAR